MTAQTTSTRRSILTAGGLIAAPLATGASAAAAEHDRLKARTARLEDEAAIGDLHRTWLRLVNTGGISAAALIGKPGAAPPDEAVRSVAPDPSGDPDAVAVAADGRTATGRYKCVVEIETTIPPTCTLAQMARAQGEGFVRRTERRLLIADYEKTDGAWRIARLEFRSAVV